MNEFIEKLIGRLEKQKSEVNGLSDIVWNNAVKMCIYEVNQLAEEYKDINIITDFLQYVRDNADNYDADNGWDLSGLIDLSIKFCEAEEHKGGWIPCSESVPVYLDNVLVCTKNGGRTIAHLKHTPIEWRDMYMNKIDDVIAWKYLDAPYQPKGE